MDHNIPSTSSSSSSSSSSSTSAAYPSKAASCPVCKKVKVKPARMRRHVESCQKKSGRSCAKCGNIFPNTDMFGQHDCDGSLIWCKLCNKSTDSLPALIKHMRRGGCVSDGYRSKDYRVNCVPNEVGVINLALNENVGDIFIKHVGDELEPLLFMASISDTVKSHIMEYCRKWNSLKVNFALEAVYSKPIIISSGGVGDEEMDKKNACFNTKASVVTLTSDVENLLDETWARISVDMDEFTTSGSGWMLERIDGMLVRLSKYTPLEAGTHINLPPHLRKRNAVRNVRAPGGECFKYAILSSLFYEIEDCNPNLLLSTHHNFNFDGISYPTPLGEIKTFEKNNNVSVNVYALDDRQKVFPLRISKCFSNNPVQHFDLLLLTFENVHHFCLITSLSRLVRSQRSRHSCKHLICKRCFTMFACDIVSKDGLNAYQRKARHSSWCNQNTPTRVEMPNVGDVSKFTNLSHQQRVPVVVYADFEALLKPIDPPSSQPSSSSSSWTRPIASHEMFAVGILVVSTVPSFQPYPNVVTLYGRDVVPQFMSFMSDLMKLVDNLYDTVQPMIITPLQEEHHHRATECGLCHKAFDRLHDVIVRHHCHLTGNYICAAHNSCNLNFKNPSFVPVFFHNLTNYDGHPLILALAENNDLGDVQVIPNTAEKFISFSKKFEGTRRWCRFLDSYRFCSSSLESLAATLPSHPRLTSFIPDTEKRNLLLRKGVFPYSYLTSWEKLNEDKLPPMSSFFDDLNNKHISEAEYVHALAVWHKFGCKTMLDYAIVYLQTDVYLLCEVFEAFRDTCLSNYKLDAPWYYTLPSLAFDAMKLMTGVELDLITDYDQLMFIERGVRGGITSCVRRHAVANNKHIPDTFNPENPSIYLVLLDCVNLYGSGMFYYKLPYGQFEWMDVTQIDINNLPDKDSDVGYLLDVDLHIPEHLHQFLDDLPPLPEKSVPPGANRGGGGGGGGPGKLLTTLLPKRDYVVHYLLLKQALRLGVKVDRINRVLKFSQSNWLSAYVEKNATLRKHSRNEFESNMFKLMSNAVYGKFLENVRNRRKMELVVTPERLRKLVGKPNFKDRTILNEHVVNVELTRESVKFDRPSYVGQAILDLSKLIMYDFMYDVLVPFYGREKISLIYMDTDSFFLRIRTDDLYDDLSRLAPYLDLSNYPKNHALHSLDNHRKLGTFKDETNGIPIREYVGLGAKCYSYMVGSDEIKKAKGVKGVAVKQQLHFEHYLNVLHRSVRTFVNFKTIRSFNHQIKTVEQSKLALALTDNKRFVLSDGIRTCAYGNVGAVETDIMMGCLGITLGEDDVYYDFL